MVGAVDVVVVVDAASVVDIGSDRDHNDSLVEMIDDGGANDVTGDAASSAPPVVKESSKEAQEASFMMLLDVVCCNSCGYVILT